MISTFSLDGKTYSFSLRYAMAAMYSPSVDDEISPNNEDYRSTAFLPPSELLPHLPSSADRTFPPQRTINRVPTSNGHPQKEPAKVQVDAQGRTLNLRSW